MLRASEQQPARRWSRCRYRTAGVTDRVGEGWLSVAKALVSSAPPAGSKAVVRRASEDACAGAIAEAAEHLQSGGNGRLRR